MNRGNDQIYLIGNLVDVEKVASDVPEFNYDGEKVVFYMQNPEGPGDYAIYVRGFFNSISHEIITPIFEKAYQRCKKVTKGKPELEFYNRKTMWGTCDVSRNRIYLNKQLIMFLKECIEFVAIHEFCHSVSLEHDQQFYSVLDYFYPAWKETEKVMGKYEKKFLDGNFMNCFEARRNHEDIICRCGVES